MKQIPNAKESSSVNWLHRHPFRSGAPCRSRRNARFLPALFLAALACAAFLVPSLSRASLMAYEGFNYPAGNLTGQNGGFGWGSAWDQINNGDSSVQSSSLAAGANAPSGYDSLSTGNKAFTPNGTREGRWLDRSPGGSFGAKGYINGAGHIGADGKTLYISFLQQPNGTAVYYEFEFHRGDLGDPGRMAGVGNDAGDNDVHFRIESPAGAGSTFSDLGAGNTSVNLYVVRIDFNLAGNSSTVTIYRNPTSATEPVTPTQQITGITADMSFDGISLGAFVNGITVTHDEVRLGETYADVISPGVYSTGVWDGGGSDNNWSTGGNWDNNVVPVFATPLTFAGSTRLNNTNDLIGVSADSITFDSAAGAFTLNGDSLGLNAFANITFNANPSAPVTQTINLSLATAGDITIGPRTNGNITINGNLTGGNQLTQAGPDNTGVLTLAGTNSLKGMVINNGTNIITGNTTINGIGGSSFFYVPDAGSSRNATLIIPNGATLTVTNGFQDAAVIARDGANGKIIQNGGTFNFAINDGSHNFLFVGASGQPNAHAEYDMNGGLLDMNGDTLGVALGVNAGNITGVVNQTGGVITNVLNLYFSPFFSTGNGIYNLTGGSLYIGSGGITVFSGGAYQMNFGGGTVGAEASWSSSLNINLTGINGPVTFNPNGNTIALSGVLSGSGGVTVNGAGVLALSGANTFTGDINVTTGSTLEFDTTGSSAGALKLANGSTLNLNFSGNYAVGSFYTNGVALPIGTYNAGNLPGFIQGSGNLQVASGISTGIWTGGGADNNWSTAGNWDNNAVPIFPHALTFAGSTKLANNNDLSGITISALTFDSAAGAFTLGGNDVTLSGAIGFNANPAAPITQTVNQGMTWTANQTLNLPANGNLTLGGNLSASADNLTTTGAGTLSLGGVDSFASSSVNGGTEIITGSTTINGTGGRVYVADGDAIPGCNGTLAIENGATFTFTGSFADYMVIGRDGANGKVIQNGGTFAFNPSDSHNILLVAAGGGAHGYGEYDINGGVLDLNGNTLGAGWGDGGAVTGMVNQAGGAINNVFELDLGVVKANGIGAYNLTGGSIAIDFGGIISDSGSYQINLGGGTVSAISGWISSLNMTLTGSNGPVTFSPNGNTILLSGILSGSGGLTVDGGGILELSGANAYAGDTTVNAGSVLQLDVTGSSTGAFRVANGGLLYLNYSGNYVVAGFYTNGVALPLGTYNAGNLPDFIASSGNLQVVSGISTGIWTGGGTDNNWSTAGNWDHNAVPIFPHALVFAGSSRLNNNNDLTGITATSLTFSNDAGAFALGGNSLGLGAFANIGFTADPAAPITQTINLPLVTAGDFTVGTRANGSLTFNGDITGGNQLTQAGPDNAGILTLGGNDSLKGMVVNNGTNIITGTTTISGIGGSSFFYVPDAGASRNATLVIQNGATLTVSGGFQDSGVIARDGANGKIIQNGGTFNFAINDGSHNFLFVGASGQPNAHAEYDMNGGLLDMNGDTLGVALGVNAGNITGVVNQTGGVITNVLNLYFSPFFSTGNGTYNLTGGSLYIGSGGITVFSGGAYQMNFGGGTVGAEASWSSSLNMNLTGNNGPVTFNPAGNTIALSGVLSGTGGLTVSGGGILELSGVNTYSGDTTVNAGSTLRLDSPGSTTGTFRAANGAVLNLNYTGTYTVANLYTNGTALPIGTYNSSNLAGFITGTGSIQVVGTVPTTPIPISFSVTGGVLHLNWPANYQGWVLQAQTNSASQGLGANWVDVAGSASTTSENIPLVPTNPTVFYRLRYPTP